MSDEDMSSAWVGYGRGIAYPIATLNRHVSPY